MLIKLNVKNNNIAYIDGLIFGNNNIIGEWIGNELAELNNLVDLSLYLNDNSVDNNAFDSML